MRFYARSSHKFPQRTDLLYRWFLLILSKDRPPQIELDIHLCHISRHPIIILPWRPAILPPLHRRRCLLTPRRHRITRSQNNRLHFERTPLPCAYYRRGLFSALTGHRLVNTSDSLTGLWFGVHFFLQGDCLHGLHRLAFDFSSLACCCLEFASHQVD